MANRSNRLYDTAYRPNRGQHQRPQIVHPLSLGISSGKEIVPTSADTSPQFPKVEDRYCAVAPQPLILASITYF